MWIWKKHNLGESSNLQASDIDVFSAGENLAPRDTKKEREEPQEIQCYKAEAAIKSQINTHVESFYCLLPKTSGPPPA